MTTVELISILTLVFSALSACAVIFGLIFARYELKEAKEMRKLQTFNSLLSHWGGTEERLARYYVENKLPITNIGIDLSKLNSEELEKLDSCLASFNRIAWIAKRNLVSLDDAIDYFGYRALVCWGKTSNLIEKRREYDNLYMGSFKWFVEKSKEWYATRGIEIPTS